MKRPVICLEKNKFTDKNKKLGENMNEKIIKNKYAMPVQDPELRAHNFKEVALGYDKKTAYFEAKRCLNCKSRPCVEGCPVNIDIPEFIAKIKEDDLEGAYEIISKSSSLPAVCGRVCPQESQCESKCTMGIKNEAVAIGRLERFVADSHNESSNSSLSPIPSNGLKVAVVGSGPSGLTCAGDLARRGYMVTVFEALHKAGGVLVYGIPEFRLPKAIVSREIEGLKSLGVDIQTNVIIGKTLTVDELFELGYEAVFIGSGAGLPRFMNIPGEGLNGVYSANEFLTRSNLMKAFIDHPITPIMKGGRVAVIGGGNVAMDAARTALRLGAGKVFIIYRRSMDELPARKEEIQHAIEEGIEFITLSNPTKIIGHKDEDNRDDPKNGFVKAIECIRMEPAKADPDGRQKPVEIPGSEFLLDVTAVVVAIGTSPNPLIKNTTDGLRVNEHGGIIVSEDGETSKEYVFAGGDAVTGAATVISAMGAGKRAAQAIDKYLSQKAKGK